MGNECFISFKIIKFIVTFMRKIYISSWHPRCYIATVQTLSNEMWYESGCTQFPLPAGYQISCILTNYTRSTWTHFSWKQKIKIPFKNWILHFFSFWKLKFICNSFTKWNFYLQIYCKIKCKYFTDTIDNSK